MEPASARHLEHEKFEALSNLAVTMNNVSDLDIMMETILTEARHFVGAEAGSIYIRDDDKLIFAYSQNDCLDRTESGEALSNYKNQEISLTGNSLASYVALANATLNVPNAYSIGLEKPYRFDPAFDRQSGYLTRSILTLPLTNIRREVIGVLQIINRLDEEGRPCPFSDEDERLMALFSSTAAMALERTQLIRQMLLRSVKMAELRDPGETTFHAQRVAALAILLYKHWALKRSLDQARIKKNMDHLRIAAMLHDVGKVGVPDHILNKPGRLSPEERREMENHVLIGLQLFEPITSELDAMIHEVIVNHHERWDGAGYPGWVDHLSGRPLPDRLGEEGRALGKKGEEISIFGRVTAVADVFDALSSKRTYKEAFDDDLVSRIMEQESGRHFDPELVEILLNNLDEAHSIRSRFPE